MRALALSLFISLTVVGCLKEDHFSKHEYKEVSVRELAEDVIITDKVWDLIQGKESGAAVADSNDSHGKKAATPTKPKITLASTDVLLVEKNENILSDRALQIKFPQGGGSLDFSRYVTTKKGTFYLSFKFSDENFQPQKIIFVNRVIPRAMGSEKWGMGCHFAVDITDKFLKENGTRGIELNTSDLRYLNVVGGTFIFSAQKENNLYVSQITFSDSRYKSLDCGVGQ